MAIVKDCIQGFKVVYPRVDDRQTLLYFQQIHHEILSKGQLEADSEDISMTDGTREYTKNSTTEEITQVRAAYYMKSTTDITKLVPTSTDWLDRNRSNWREAATQVESGTTTSTTSNKLVDSGQNFDETVAVNDTVSNTTDTTETTVSAVDSATTLSLNSDIMTSAEAYIITSPTTGRPIYFYVEATDSSSQTTAGQVIVGFDPIPDTTKSGAYPIVRLYGSIYQILLEQEEIPAIIPSIRVYVEGMKMLWAADRDPERLPLWERMYEKELHKCLVYIDSTIEDLDPIINPDWMHNRKVQ